MKLQRKIFSNPVLLSNVRLKWIILWVAAALSIASIYYTHTLINQLKDREIAHIHLYAKALEHTLNSKNSNILFATEEVIYKNNSIPTILIDEKEGFVFYENLNLDTSLSLEEKDELLQRELASMKRMYPPIEIALKDPNTGEEFGRQFIYYKNSYLLTRLITYPYIQLVVIAVFGFIAYMAFSFSKANEQNRLWVALAKETAHQIGTPLSSLMAWVETLRDNPASRNKEIADELDKDVEKLLVVTERFSSIGSTPVLKKGNLYPVIDGVKKYLEPRIPPEVNIVLNAPPKPIEIQLHAPLMEWVVETLCKNALDAIGHAGTITITLHEDAKNNAVIDVADTGKGIPKAIMNNLFKPGFTTKKHGWGLGLALSKRIVEQYHGGKISVKFSERGLGTTFRIVLKRDDDDKR